nr:1900_t:CDS:1 [Entrophospora candida]
MKNLHMYVTETSSSNDLPEIQESVSDVKVPSLCENNSQLPITTLPNVPEAELSGLPSDTIANISKSSPSRQPISTLSDDPEEKQKHTIKMTLDHFSYLPFNYSDEYDDYFDCPEICLACNKEHKTVI